MNKFGERLKELREEKGLTQEELAEAIGYSDVSIYYWETGKRLPYLDTAIVIAQFFKVSLDYLAGIED